jgi:hypothetical protein
MPSKTPSQARLMAACAHGAGYAACPPETVAKEFNQADKGTGMIGRKKVAKAMVQRGGR